MFLLTNIFTTLIMFLSSEKQLNRRRFIVVTTGSRYIITTRDNCYVTSSIKVDESSRKVVFPLWNSGANVEVCEVETPDIITIHKESYMKTDVTEDVLALQEV